MDERDENPNFDLTTPTVRLPNNPHAPSGDFDKTSANTPPRGYNPPPHADSPRNKFDLTSVNYGVHSSADPEDEAAYRRSPAAAPPPDSFDQTANYPATPQPPQYAPYAQGSPYQQGAPYQQQGTPYQQQGSPYQQQVAPYPQQQQGAPYQPAQAVGPKRRVPVWAWLLAGVLFIFVLAGAAVGLYFFLSYNPTFTLKVLNAPPGSRVYVDGSPSGISQSDGSILVQSLRADEPREVRVTREGFADWRITVEGERGEVKEVSAVMPPVEASLPAEIDYGGPMVLVTAGPFMMGDSARGPEERPAHEVTLPDYYIDKFEVTNEQYKKFCDETGHARPVNPFWSPDYFEANPRHPVLGVSYTDAEAYAKWAGKRLPTEAEWEKAASWDPKAKQKRPWPWGDAREEGRANIGQRQGRDQPEPKPVGYFMSGASAYGAQDMAGNADEWVDAVFQPYPGNAALHPDFGKGLRVARGGDFGADLEGARTTVRLPLPADFRTRPEDAAADPPTSSLIGFRCAVSADDPKLKAHLQQTKK